MATTSKIKEDPDGPGTYEDNKDFIMGDNNITGLKEEKKDVEDDEIVREIDVYVSSALSSKLSLVQFPLQTASSRRVRKRTDKEKEKERQQSGENAADEALINKPTRNSGDPTGARIRSLHNILELEFPLPYHSGDKQFLSTMPYYVTSQKNRRLRSSSIPLNTHVALGNWSSDGKSIVLTPLLGGTGRGINDNVNATGGVGSQAGVAGGGGTDDTIGIVGGGGRSVLQMRPSFAHIDEADKTSQAGATTELPTKSISKKPTSVLLQAQAKKGGKGDNDARGILGLNEASENWVYLQIHGEDSDLSDEYRNLLDVTGNSLVPPPTIEFMNNIPLSSGDSSRRNKKKESIMAVKSYMKTLNYLPPSLSDVLEDEFELLYTAIMSNEKGEIFEGMDDDDDDPLLNLDDEKNNRDMSNLDEEALKEKKDLRIMKLLTDRITKQMFRSGGVPIPYQVLKRKFITPMLDLYSSGTSSDDDDEDDLETTVKKRHLQNLFALALSASSVLIRGSSFVLKSNLMMLSSPLSDFSFASYAKNKNFPTVKKEILQMIRDALLYILNRDGIIQRHMLFRMERTDDLIQNGFVTTSSTNGLPYNETQEEKRKKIEEENTDSIKFVNHQEKIEHLLNQLCVKDENCWKLKYSEEQEENESGDCEHRVSSMFEQDFPDEAQNHYFYWEKKKMSLQYLIDQYDGI